MCSLIDELKAHARVLHRRALAGEPAALARLGLAGTTAAGAEAPRRRHCLSAVARELGFSGWAHAVAVLEGRESRDFGTLLYPAGGAAHLNIWCSSYDQARAAQADGGGYLLAYRRQCFVAGPSFVVTLGLDPRHPDWDAIDRDWVRPRQPDARQRLYAELIRGALAAQELAA